MNIKQQLLQDRSKESILLIANYIGDDPERYKILIDLFMGDESRVTQRASWIMSHCYDNHPGLAEPYLPLLWERIQQPCHNALKRNVLRIMQDIDIPEALQGRVATHCFDYLADPNEAIAIRVFSMSVLFNIGRQEPELLDELALLIEEHLPYGSAGFRSRGNKLLKKIRKIRG